MKLLILAFVALAAFGCASAPYQTDQFLQRPHGLPQTQLIRDVPFFQQSAGYCGPATLAMVMNWAHHKVEVDEIAPQVYTPGMKGSLQTDMITASRRNGLMAISVSDVEALFTEVAAGHPVVVFENLAIKWWPRWHYAVVLGYDFNTKEVVLHSGPNAFERVSFHEFEQSWKLGDYWGLVVLPPGTLSVSADEFANAKAAAALEQIGKLAEADLAYKKVLEKWPESLTANIGAANIAFTRKNPAESVKYLLKATKAHPDSEAAKHNLAVAKNALMKLKAKTSRSSP
jgi:tetratricopeptide (TPR) repeat protein